MHTPKLHWKPLLLSPAREPTRNQDAQFPKITTFVCSSRLRQYDTGGGGSSPSHAMMGNQRRNPFPLACSTPACRKYLPYSYPLVCLVPSDLEVATAVCIGNDVQRMCMTPPLRRSGTTDNEQYSNIWLQWPRLQQHSGYHGTQVGSGLDTTETTSDIRAMNIPGPQ